MYCGKIRKILCGRVETPPDFHQKMSVPLFLNILVWECC